MGPLAVPLTTAGLSSAAELICRMQVIPAHLCYIVAGVIPAAYDPSSRLCLPGGDHRRHPRTFASTEAIQAGLLLEWARMQGWIHLNLVPVGRDSQASGVIGLVSSRVSIIKGVEYQSQ